MTEALSPVAVPAGSGLVLSSNTMVVAPALTFMKISATPAIKIHLEALLLEPQDIVVLPSKFEFTVVVGHSNTGAPKIRLHPDHARQSECVSLHLKRSRIFSRLQLHRFERPPKSRPRRVLPDPRRR